jgi:hypothetical protein
MELMTPEVVRPRPAIGSLTFMMSQEKSEVELTPNAVLRVSFDEWNEM